MKDRLGEVQVLAAAVVDIRAVAGENRPGQVQGHVRGHVFQKKAGTVVSENVVREAGIVGGGLVGVEGKARLVILKHAIPSVDMRIHALYALSEREEGYIVWHHKKAGMPWYRDIVLMIRFIRRLPPLVTQKMILIRKDWQDYTLAHANDRDYIDVSLIAVKKEYQGTGCLRKLLAEPFAEAERCGCACILDTDSSRKAAKYMHVGMQCEKDAVLESGVHMYTMRYPQI